LLDATPMNTRWFLLWVISLAAVAVVSMRFPRAYEQWRSESAEIAMRLEQQVAALDDDVRALDDDVRRFASDVEAMRPDVAVEPPTPVELPPPAVVRETVAPPPPSDARRFLSFELSKTGFAFDAPRRYVIVKQLSRVGFDARSTIHDFSGSTSDVTGEIVTCLARPAEGSRGSISVSAAELTTQDPDRDANMRENLDIAAHPQLGFVIESFRSSRVDATHEIVEGEVTGKLEIRGVTHDVTMPVRVSVEPSKRVVVEGEMWIHLPDFGVPVPNKLGLLRMNPNVRVWISLRLRAVGVPNEAENHEVADAR
jgi:polyisoprenoid-binding protein YceI